MQAGKFLSAYWAGGDVADQPDDHVYDPIRHDVVKDMPVAEEVSVLTPMIFVRGFGGNNASYVGQCREVASHGYLVLCIDTHDGTCEYTEKENGTPLCFNTDIDMDCEETIKECLKLRVADVSSLIDEM